MPSKSPSPQATGTPADPGADDEIFVGRWRVRPSDGTLDSAGRVERVEPRVMEVLLCLVRRAGEVVPRDELLEEAWRDTHVAPIALSRCISQLRRALEDNARPRRYIETLPKRGYRLVAPVRAARDDSSTDRPISVPPAPRSRRGAAYLGASAAAILVALLFGSEGGPLADRLVNSPVARVARTSELDGVDTLIRRARDFYARQRFEDNENAIVLLEQALEIEPHSATARAELANAYAKRGFYAGYDAVWIERAEAEARRAIAIDPGNAAAFKALGLALSTRGALTESVAAYRRAVSLDADYGDALANLAAVLWRTGRWDQSLTYAARAVQLGEPTVTAIDNVADMLAALGLSARAADWRAWAVRIEPNRVDTVADLAYEDLYAGRIEEARQRIRQLAAAVPNCPVCTVVRGDIELLSGNLEGAYEFVAAEYDANPDGRLASLRYAALIARTDPERAATILRRVETEVRAYLDGGADWWAGPWAMAAIAAIRHDRDATLEWFERAIEAGRFNWRYDELDPKYDWLAHDPEFQTLLQRMRDRTAELRQRVIAQGLIGTLPDPPTIGHRPRP